MIKPDVRVIGIGSHYGSDAAGWLACETLKSQAISTRIDWKLCRTPSQLPDLVIDYKAVVILDAILSDQPNGQVLPLQWPIHQEAYHSPCSSHGLGVIDALQLAATLGQLPVLTYILGISVNEQQLDAATLINSALPQLQHELDKIQKNIVT